MKIVVSDPKTGKSYQTEADEDKSKLFYGMKLGEEVEGSLAGLTGYTLKLTGGSDKEGFPMRKDFHGTDRKKILLSTGPGFRKKAKGERRKKTVRGNTITENAAQINMVVVKEGPKKIDEILGAKDKEEKKE